MSARNARRLILLLSGVAGGPTTYARSATADAVVQVAGISKASTANAAVQVQGISKAGTADAYVAVTTSRTATADAVVQVAGISKAATGDGVVQVAGISKAGMRGIAVSFVNYLDELPYFADEVLPRLVAHGVRSRMG